MTKSIGDKRFRIDTGKIMIRITRRFRIRWWSMIGITSWWKTKFIVIITRLKFQQWTFFVESDSSWLTFSFVPFRRRSADCSDDVLISRGKKKQIIFFSSLLDRRAQTIIDRRWNRLNDVLCFDIARIGFENICHERLIDFEAPILVWKFVRILITCRN